MLVDSHCHLDKLDYEQLHTGIDDVLAKAKARGVEYFLSVGVTLKSFPAMMEMIEPHENVFASCGVHPLDIEAGFDFEVQSFLLFWFCSLLTSSLSLSLSLGENAVTIQFSS